MSTAFFDQLETRDPDAREQAMLALLPSFIRKTLEACPSWAEHLAGHDPGTLVDRQGLARLPLMRKSQIKALQGKRPPLGGLATPDASRYGRIFMSPGPIFEPEGLSVDSWRTARALFAAGIRRGDIVHNTFAYHLTPGGWIVDAGARALGCTVIPAGPGNNEQQLEIIAHLQPNVYIGVPDYLKILLDKAKEAKREASSFKKAFVSGGALFPSLRAEYKSRGISCLQCYATADLGLVAYESAAPDGSVEGMIVDEGVIVEIVRPGTGDPVPEGEVGEIVVTSFNRDYPMIRLATGDLSAVLPGRSPCGRTNMRIKGWLGRADQTTKVKGMFVHPESIAEVAKRHPELGRLRLVVTRQGEQDVMTLKAEAKGAATPELMSAVAKTLQDVTKMRGEVAFVAPGSLPNDGKVIADDRTYG